MIPAQPAPHRIDLHPLMPLYLVIFIAFIGYSMMVTIFVPMLMDGGGFFHEGAASGTKTVYAGLVLALYPLGQFFGAPVLGALSDRYGRKRVLSISLLVTILFYLVIAYSLRVESLWLLMSACFLCGLSESNVAIVRSAIADVSGTDDRGRLFAYVYAATSLGYIAGPLLGGQFAVHFGYAAPFWIVIGLLVIAYVWMLAAFRDAYEPKAGEPMDYFKTFTNLATVFTDIPIRKVYLVNFLLYLSAFGFWRVIQMYMVDEWKFGVGKVTFYYSYLAIVAFVANMLLFAPLSRRMNLKSLIIWMAVGGGIFTIVIVIPKSEVSYWFTAGPACAFFIMTMAACSAYLSGLVSGDRQGRVLGNNLGIQVGAESLSAVLGGFLAAVLVPLPLITYGITAILGGLLLVTYKNPDTPD